MAELNRAEFIELLNRLGAEDDQEALAAARALSRAVADGGVTWDDLLQPEGATPPGVAAADTGAADADDADGSDDPGIAPDAPEDDEDPADDAAEDEEEKEPALPADKSEDGRLLDRLLARKGLSKTLRDELRDLKRAHAGGGLDAMDRRYIRALVKRLGA